MFVKSNEESPGAQPTISCRALHCSGLVILFTLITQKKQAQKENIFHLPGQHLGSTVAPEDSWHMGLASSGWAGRGQSCRGIGDGRQEAGRDVSCLMLMEHTVASLKFASWRFLHRELTISPNERDTGVGWS